MRRWLGVLVALVLASPAAAQDKPAWVGVWEGTVGTYPVRLCIDTEGDGSARGSYYYLSQLEPIALRQEDGGAAWIETTPGGDETALWVFTKQTGAQLNGTWHQRNRSLAFALHPVAWSEGEWGGACGSEAFLEPRLRNVSDVRQEPASLDGFNYTRDVFVPPAQFRDDVTIETFQFAPEQSGDPAILQALRARLPSGTMRDEFVACLGGAIAWHGGDGYFAESLEPVMATREFLVAHVNTDTECGGLHPNTDLFYKTFDRRSGAEVDLFTWLNAQAREHHPAEPGGLSYDIMLPPLRDLIVSHAPSALSASGPSDQEAFSDECRDVIEDQEFWTLGLSREGMLFEPSLPHVVLACTDTFTVPWDELAPYLSEAGRAGLARLRAK